MGRDLLVAPTILAGLRSPETVYRYDDPLHPNRVTSSVQIMPWTPEDNALLLGLARYEESLCPGCGVPKHLAWHSELEGFWEHEVEVICHACTAAQPEPDGGKQRPPVVYRSRPRVELEYDMAQLPPFVMGETTTPPD
jgi:hypothetical protein